MATVTANIKDPLGNLWSNAIVIASFIGQNVTPGAGPYVTGGVPSGQFETVVPGSTDSSGNFSMLVTGNDTITPTPSTWRWTVVNSTGKISFAVNVQITGASIDISAALQAASPSLAQALAPGSVLGNLTINGTLTVTGTTSLAGLTTSGNINAGANSLTVGAGAFSGTITATAAPGITATNAGVFSNTQQNEYVTSSLNSCSAGTEFHAANSAGQATDGIAGCVATPSVGTVIQTNGVAGYANNLSTSINAVGIFGTGRALATNVSVWGGNVVASDGGFAAKVIGFENDCNITNASTTGACVTASGAFSITFGGTTFPAYLVGAPIGGGQWSAGFLTRDAATLVGIQLGAQGTGASQPSQNVNLTYRNPSNVAHTVALQAQSTNNLLVNCDIPGCGVVLTGSSSGTAALVSPATGGGTTTLPVTTGALTDVVASTLQKTESAADTNLLTFTPPAAAGSYRVRFILGVSASSAATLGWTATWTDSNGTSVSPTNLALFQQNVAAPALTFTVTGVAIFYGQADIDVNNSASNIVVKLTFSGTSFTAKATATIERIL